IHYFAPPKRTIEPIRLLGISAHRPVVKKRPPSRGRQRVEPFIVVSNFMIIPDDIDTGIREKSLARGVIAVVAVFGPELRKVRFCDVAVRVVSVREMVYK